MIHPRLTTTTTAAGTAMTVVDPAKDFPDPVLFHPGQSPAAAAEVIVGHPAAAAETNLKPMEVEIEQVAEQDSF